jgi:hypothetical protein
MLRTSLLYPLTALLLVCPGLVAAQPQWDAAGTIGVFAGHTPRPDAARYSDDWFQAAQGGLIVGRHVTRQLKVEIDGSITGPGRQIVERLVTIPGFPAPYPVGAEVETSVGSLGMAVTWQFRDNEWVHPFARVGVSADFERRQLVRAWDQAFYPSGRGGPGPTGLAGPAEEGPTTTTSARAMVGGGAKLYVSPHTFVRTEGIVAFGRSRQNVILRIGFGLDF